MTAADKSTLQLQICECQHELHLTDFHTSCAHGGVMSLMQWDFRDTGCAELLGVLAADRVQCRDIGLQPSVSQPFKVAKCEKT